MAGGLLLQPSYAQDIKYAAYQDRLLMKSLGVQAGVVGENDFKVTAGTGLQVEVEKGKGFVEQTNENQEVGNTFYNGLYNILGPTKQNPYNSVEIPTTAPQIAQIILRIYDVNELGIGGSTYARIEWLNGIPNTLASETVIKEGKASIFGAVALPTSSFRCAYVVVPKNATTSSEYSIVDERTFSSVGAWKSPTEQNGHLVALSPGQTMGFRTENRGSTVRLRGGLITESGKTLGKSELVITAPRGYAPPAVLPNVGIDFKTLAGVYSKVPVEVTAAGKMILLAAPGAEGALTFDSITWNLT
jgi:hypothetical protein